MNIPTIKCKVEIICPVNLSEDLDKIKQAISNIFPDSTIKNEIFSIKAQSNELKSLKKISETISSSQSQKIYTRNLENNLEGDSTWFFLNKQAAFVGIVAICDEAEESPLGPIKVTLTSSNIDAVIDWISFLN
ncbi:MAG: RNA-binding domain-containing protein [Candidatus Nitrosopumilus sp. Bin_571-38]|jgi:uncharacterized protein